MLLGMDIVWLEAECSRYEFFADVIAQTHPDIGLVAIDHNSEKALRLLEELALKAPDCALLVELELPAGPIRFMAMPVRHEPLEGQVSGEGGHLIGVRITQLGGDARARLSEYLRSARKG